MATVVIQQEQEAVRIPVWVSDLPTFRRWAKSEEFPQHGWYAYLNGELWVDPSMEPLRRDRLKNRFAVTLTPLAEKRPGLGIFLGDRMLLTNIEAGLSTEPDGMFLSYDSLRERRARLDEGDESVEVEGSPDMVLEVISPTSRHKDTVILRDLYWRAEVKEYWLANPGRAAGVDVEFEILKRGPRGFIPVRKGSSRAGSDPPSSASRSASRALLTRCGSRSTRWKRDRSPGYGLRPPCCCCCCCLSRSCCRWFSC
jgi:Uma2 family endonuclease